MLFFDDWKKKRGYWFISASQLCRGLNLNQSKPKNRRYQTKIIIINKLDYYTYNSDNSMDLSAVNHHDYEESAKV